LFVKNLLINYKPLGICSVNILSISLVWFEWLCTIPDIVEVGRSDFREG